MTSPRYCAFRDSNLWGGGFEVTEIRTTKSRVGGAVREQGYRIVAESQGFKTSLRCL